VRFPDVYSVLALHDQILDKTGGQRGILNRTAVESALERAAWGPFGNVPDLFDRAALLLRGICQDHPFADGNKRTAFEATDLLLAMNGRRIAAPPERVVALMLAVAQGQLELDSIAGWLRGNTKDNHQEDAIE
jgi:death on curing protein